MRILFWSETFWPRIGGVENLAARLLPALQSRGHEFAVITWDNVEDADQILYQDIPVYRFPFFSGRRRNGLGPLIENRREIASAEDSSLHPTSFISIPMAAAFCFILILSARTRLRSWLHCTRRFQMNRSRLTVYWVMSCVPRIG